MKKLLLVVLALGIVFWGCSENTSLTGPEKADVQNSFLKVDDNSSTTLMEKKTVISKEIDGEKGGKVKINLKQGKVKAKGNLNFKKGVFSDEETIEVSLVGGMAAFDFYPESIEFNEGKHALLTVKISGIKFKKGDSVEDFDFFYIDSDKLYEVEYKKIIIDKKHKWIKVVDAQLTHFSRYGFNR